MFHYFFTYTTDIPKGLGFSLFGKEHMTWLAGIIILGACLCVLYRKSGEQRRLATQRVLGTMILVFDLYKDVVLVVTGKFNTWELPFDLCGLAVFICFAYAWTNWDKLDEILYFLCMPGAVSALLFPNWTRYPQLNYMNIHSFLIHGLLVVFPMMLIIGGRVRPRFSHYYRVWAFLAVLVPIELLLNAKLGTNFLFLEKPSAGSPLVPLFELTGEHFYYLGFALLVAGVNFLMYLPFLFLDIRERMNWKSGKGSRSNGEKRRYGE